MTKLIKIKNIQDLSKNMDIHYKHVKKQVLDELKQKDSLFEYNSVSIKIKLRNKGIINDS